jgi:predicted DNA-binding transcriptional regulator AlpA
MAKLKVNTQPTIPAEGYIRVSQLLGTRRGTIPILPISRRGLYAWIKAGRWPAPVTLGPKVIAWPASVVRTALQEMESLCPR